jgi:hypothetical protein
MPLPEELNEPGRPDHQLPNIISCPFFLRHEKRVEIQLDKNGVGQWKSQ